MTYPEKLQRFASEAQDPYYPFACGCFNVTQMLVVFFRLRGGTCASPVPGVSAADCRQVKHIVALCQRVQPLEGCWAQPPAGLLPARMSVLNELFCALVEGLHLAWVRLSSEENVTLMAFPRALREVHEAHAAFWSRPVASVTSFEALRSCPRKTSLAEEGATWLIASLRSTQCAFHKLQAHLVGLLWAALWRAQGELQDVLCEENSRLEVLWHRQQAEERVSQHGSYRPPELPLARAPFARSAGELDVDAALARLGMNVEDKISNAHQGDLTEFLDKCLSSEEPAEAKSATVKEAVTQQHDLDSFLTGWLLHIQH